MFFFQDRIKQSELDCCEESPEVALEEPPHPEIPGITQETTLTTTSSRSIPDTHFMVVEEDQPVGRNPCAQCLIL